MKAVVKALFLENQKLENKFSSCSYKKGVILIVNQHLQWYGITVTRQLIQSSNPSSILGCVNTLYCSICRQCYKEKFIHFNTDIFYFSSFRLFDLGLRQQSKTHLLLELLIPTIFSIVIVVQLHFFHKPLMMKINRILRCRKNNRKRNRAMVKSSSTSRASSRVGDSSSANTMSATTLSTTDQQSISEEEVEDQTILSTMERIIQLYKTTTVILWRFAEIHISKIICFIVMLVVVQQV